jgi:hypothetical protein
VSIAGSSINALFPPENKKTRFIELELELELVGELIYRVEGETCRGKIDRHAKRCCLTELARARYLSLQKDGGNLAEQPVSVTPAQSRQGAFKHEKQCCVLSHKSAPPRNWLSQNLNEQFLLYRIQEYIRIVNIVFYVYCKTKYTSAAT